MHAVCTQQYYNTPMGLNDMHFGDMMHGTHFQTQLQLGHKLGSAPLSEWISCGCFCCARRSSTHQFESLCCQEVSGEGQRTSPTCLCTTPHHVIIILIVG